MQRATGFIRFSFIAFLLLLVGALSACGNSAQGNSPTPPPKITLNVFAAASLNGVFTQIGKQFDQAHPGNTTVFNFAGSQQLAQQISQGATTDVFASANQTQMNVVVQSGEVDASTSKVFVHNLLTVVFPQSNPGQITTLQDLAKPGLKIVLAAKTVPAGQYALDFLSKASKDPSFAPNYQANVLKNVVSYETDVESVLTKVSLGEADAGIVYTSDAASTTGKQLGKLSIPTNLQTEASYPIAPIKGSKNAARAQQFVDYVLSSAGQQALGQFGFIPLSASTSLIAPAVAETRGSRNA